MIQNKLKILLVDDNESVIESLSKFFKIKEDRYQIDIASNGALALDKYQKFKPDVVIMDISMPIMDGLDALSRILRIDQEAKIIMSTATDEKRITELCIQRGALGFITKPYSPEDLLVYIEKSLKGGSRNKEVVTLFTRVTNRMATSIRKITGIETSITIDDIEIHPHRLKTLAEPNYSPRNISKDETVKITTTSEQVGFTNEIGGQLDGMIVSVIYKKNLYDLFDHTSDSDITNNKAVFFEFFNVLNLNVISELADSMNVKLDALPIREYIEDSDSIVEGKNLTKVKYNLSYNERKCTLEIYLWLNIAGLFQRL